MSKIKILFVCLGNICRSPLAHGIMLDYLSKYNLFDLIEVDSAGTGTYHVGYEPDKRAILVAKNHHIELKHIARKFTCHDLTNNDFILVMDHLNYEDVMSYGKNENFSHKVFRLRSFDAKSVEDYDVPDPYYGLESDFEDVFTLCNRSIFGFLNFLITQNLLDKHLKLDLLHS